MHLKIFVNLDRSHVKWMSQKKRRKERKKGRGTGNFGGGESVTALMVTASQVYAQAQSHQITYINMGMFLRINHISREC